MLNEPAASVNNRATVIGRPGESQSSRDTIQDQLLEVVSHVMNIYEADVHESGPVRGRFTGRLLVDSEEAYTFLDEQFAQQDFQAILTTDDAGNHVVMALKGRINPRPRPVWPNWVLLGLTILSLLYVGAAQDAAMRDLDAPSLAGIWRGWPYALSVLLILGAHELGHYFAARYHRVNVTPPYFIPLPFGFFGTLGAFIQLREPMRNFKTLFDVGVAGPLAGFVVAVPVLFIGLATSNVESLPDQAYILEGDSILYAGAKFVVFGEVLPSDTEDVFINQVAKAGWTGLLITGLNLIPLGQLDGGHVVLTLFGKRAQKLYMPVLGVFLVLSLFNSVWLLWTVLLYFLGRVYAIPMDTVTRLDARRRWVGYLTLFLFILVFVPNPLQVIEP